MKEYMDEHGLDSENDIPDDVWNDCRNKSFENIKINLIPCLLNIRIWIDS